MNNYIDFPFVIRPLVYGLVLHMAIHPVEDDPSPQPHTDSANNSDLGSNTEKQNSPEYFTAILSLFPVQFLVSKMSVDC